MINDYWRNYKNKIRIFENMSEEVGIIYSDMWRIIVNKTNILRSQKIRKCLIRIMQVYRQD